MKNEDQFNERTLHTTIFDGFLLIIDTIGKILITCQRVKSVLRTSNILVHLHEFYYNSSSHSPYDSISRQNFSSRFSC